MNLKLKCAVCAAVLDVEVDSRGWAFRYGSINLGEGQAFCPKHTPTETFLESQCPGCVGGWPECRLYDAVSGADAVSPDVVLRIAEGFCPFRTNGSFSVNLQRGSSAEIKRIDLSERAPTEAARLFAETLRWKRENR